MNFNDFDFIDSSKFIGKLIITSFTCLIDNVRFEDAFFLDQLNTFKKNSCSSITSFVEDNEFEKICNKKYFVEKIYQNNLKWYHLPIKDLNSPNSEFKFKWETIRILLKKELMQGKNVVFHSRGGKGRAGTVAALLLIDCGLTKKEAIRLVRLRRKGAIETTKQKDFILNYNIIK